MTALERGGGVGWGRSGGEGEGEGYSTWHNI